MPSRRGDNAGERLSGSRARWPRIRLALPVGIAAVCVGNTGGQILIATTLLTIADVLTAARRCVSGDGQLVRIVRTDELRRI